MKQPKKSIVEVVQKEMPEFVDAVAGLNADELNARLVQNAKDVEANEEAKEVDEDLAQARATASEFAAPYREARKMLKLKASYLVQLLKDKGAV